MKAALLVLFILACSLLGALNIFNETFDTGLPAGWTQTGSAGTHWVHNATNSAGGTAGELRFSDSPYETGTYRFISPAFDTRKVHDMYMSFKHFLDWYASPFTVSVQISTDGTNWSTVWSATPTADIGPENVYIGLEYAYGMSQTTYIAFCFEGYTYNINSWYIDNVVLSYTNTLGSGTWGLGTYYPIGNVIVPNGHTLTLQAGATVYMGNNTLMDVDGSLKVNGNENSVVFIGCTGGNTWKGIELNSVVATNDSTIIKYANIMNSTESGIYINYTHKVRISNCNLAYNSVSSNNLGGGLYCYASNIVVENSMFHDNTANLRGAAADFLSCNPIFRNNSVFNNTVNGYGILSFANCNLSGVKHNQISNNYFNADAVAALYMANCQGTLEKNIINNNNSYGIYTSSGIYNPLVVSHCDIMYNNPTGIYIASNPSLQIENSIIWGNTNYQIFGQYNPTEIPVRYCCIQNGMNGINYIPSSYVTNYITDDPLLMDSPNGAGAAYYSSMLDFRLQDFSPCIDAGDPIFYDDDFSVPDIGVYNRLLKPALYRAADVTPDQGHQIDLRWYRNDKDYTWDPSAWYHVFRWVGDSRSIPAQATVVTDPREITPELVSQNQAIYWNSGTRILYFLGQVKAMNRPSYGLIVPTLQDSSSTGTHDEVFVVTYFDDVYFWDSVGLAGYSVDNIPPMAARNLDIARAGTNIIQLDWEEVTEGIWEGNSYPEINPITYMVYAGDTPDFEINPSSFLMSTADPYAVLLNQAAEKRFYRIIASDSE